MSQGHYSNYGHGVGIGNVGSYQVSGRPFITGSTIGASGSEKKVSFPFVTKSVTIIASGTNGDPLIKVHFNSKTSGDVINGLHYITLDSHGDSMTFDVRCKELFITSENSTSGFELYASLTNITSSQMWSLTGSGLTSHPDS